ncbi:MAG: hypothetical protein WC867_08500 [Candidatus Pacearchaeota archaeon]|jgi:hypothetical protein
MATNPITKLFEREISYELRSESRPSNPILDNIYNPLKDQSISQIKERKPFFDTLVRPDYKSRN